MEQAFILTFIVVLLFCLCKYLESRYLSTPESTKPLKEIVRDIFIVFGSSFLGSYLFFHFHGTINDFFNAVTETKVLNPATTQIFTDVPTF